MAATETEKRVQSLLRNLSGLDPLKQLFWQELNYEHINQPLSRRDWTTTAANALVEDPLLFALGGIDQAFQVVYARLASPKLLLGYERPVISRLLRDHPYALFVISNQAQDRWHFVNVKYDEKTDKRKLFRRITVGPHERLRTASERIALLDIESTPADLFGRSALAIQTRHDTAFDVEKVTEEFFKGYHGIFKRLQDDLAKQTKELRWAHDYALQFLNRVMFLYFIQRKGWLGGDTEFLSLFWGSYQKSNQPKDSFFDRWLKVLFFEAFNDKYHGGHKQFPESLHNILALAPYLNGGLFAENDLDTSQAYQISDARFSEVFTYLEKYNFTIAEDSPLDQEVAVDPEMIGKVYESLINVSSEGDERGDAGIFYTPRTEIDLMCRLSLVDNLANHVGEQHKSRLYEAVFAFEADEKQAADKGLVTAGIWPQVDAHLRQLTLVDPACGSGSFLVGMLHILDDLQERANQQLKRTESAFERKKRIIGHGLYGVDVMDWACHVAELRLWLALVIDADFSAAELHVRNDPLLPHFTFKVRCGDSLVQTIGGINLAHLRGSSDVSRELKTRLTTLKQEKLKFYANDPTCKFRTAGLVAQEELGLFRDMLMARGQALQRKIGDLNMQIAGASAQLPMAGVGTAKPQQLRLEAQIWQQQIETLLEELEHVKRSHEALKNSKEAPFVWDIAFVEIFESDQAGFDIVVGNPPYVRHENIAAPNFYRAMVSAEKKRDYKEELANAVYQSFPHFFSYNKNTKITTHKLDAKSDLYVYFYFLSLALLNRQGSFCFITSNSWLDVGYGADLQEFLLKEVRVRLVLDNLLKRSFKSADVNTVIALLSAPCDRSISDSPLDNTTRFVMFKAPFEHIISAVIFEEIEESQRRVSKQEFRVFPIRQKNLLADGTERPLGSKDDKDHRDLTRKKRGNLGDIARYTGNKWGGKYLRAPDIFWTIQEKGNDKLVRLGDVARVETYLNTGGADGFFIVRGIEHSNFVRITSTDGEEFDLPRTVIRPFFKSPQEITFLDTAKCEPQWFLVLPTQDAKDSAVKEYVKWGETQGYHRRSATSRRVPWYGLPPQATNPAPLIWPRLHNERLLFALNEHRVSYTNFYGIWHPSSYRLSTSLASTVCGLSREILGKTNFGQGVLKTDGNDLVQIVIPKPELMDVDIAFGRLLNRPILPLWDEVKQEDRRQLDQYVFDLLKLTRGECDAVYEAVLSLVRNRVNKAGSFSKTSIQLEEDYS